MSALDLGDPVKLGVTACPIEGSSLRGSESAVPPGGLHAPMVSDVPAAARTFLDRAAGGPEPLVAPDLEVPSSLVHAVVSASDTLSEGHDVETIVGHLLEVAQRLVERADISVVLADESGKLALLAASTDRMRVFEEQQIERSEGPSIDSFRSGEPSDVQISEEGDFPWPDIARLARVVGYRSIRAIPLRLREETIGVLSIAEEGPHSGSPLQMAFLQALVDSTTIGLINRRLYAASLALSRQLQGALSTRVLVEQSKGAIAARLGLTVDEAFRLLRSYARGTNQRMEDVSRAVLEGSLSTQEIWSRAKH